LSDSSIATISSTGLLKVKKSGILRVSVKDANNSTSTTSNIQLYDTYLKISDTTSPIGTEINVPVKIRALPIGQSVYSAQGRIYTTNPANLALTDIITVGSGFAGAALSKSVGSNYIQFAIASTTPVSGNSILFYIKCYETPNNQTGWNTGLYFQNLMLNEGTPLPFQQIGGVTTACAIAPNFIAQDTFKVCGSSYVLNATSGYSSYNWSNGATSSSITVTQSGWYKCSVSNTGGCFGIDSAYVLFKQPKFTTLNATSCNSYLLPWGVTVTSSGLYSNAYLASNGCDSTVSVNVIIKKSSTSNTSVNVCGLSNPYTWNGRSYTSSGTYSYTTTNAVGCDSVAILNLSVTSIVPTVSPAITQTLVSNLCGARKYRYSAATTANATGYNWILPTSVGGIYGVTLDSGNASSSRVILVTYASNAAALSTDSIKVRAYSGCGFTAYKAAKLSNAALNVPASPSAITITSLISNVCGNRVYRYSVPSLPAGTATIVAATGYVWEFVGSLSEYANIDSGDVNSQKIVVSYTSNTAAATGDSIKFYYTSDCGNSLTKAAKLTNTALKEPAAPTAITITSLQTNVCGARKYRYSAPNLPLASTTAGAATGYVWNFVGTLKQTMTIDSGDLNSQKFTVTFTSNAASAAGDSVRVYYTSDCGNSLRKTAKLSNTALVAPAAATALTITPLQTNVCSARRYRYSAPNLPTATTTAGAASGYVWDVIGSLSSTMTIDSGNLFGQRFKVTFTSNAGAATSDSVRVLYTSAGCGNSARKAAKLSNTLLSAPAVPASITIATKSDVCNARTYRYTAPTPLPVATTTAGAASGYLWSTPTGTVGSTGTIDSGTVTSRIITVKYTSNAAAGAGDSIRLRYTTAGCGNSAIKAQKLSNLVKTGCVPSIAKNTSRVQATIATSMEVKVYPNPTTSQFNVQVKSSGTEEAVVRVLDVTGRFIKNVIISSNSNVNVGSDLKAGAYMLEVRQGKEVKIIRVVKF
jgi:peroxiredoxin family protein